MATRRGLFGFLTIPLWAWAGKAFAASPSNGSVTITINPRELWLREIVYTWLRNAKNYELHGAKQWSDELFPRFDIVYLSDVLGLTYDGLRNLLTQPWPEMRGGGMSHINGMARSLALFEEDGRLRLHLNPNKPDYMTASNPDVHRAYAIVFPIVRDLLI